MDNLWTELNKQIPIFLKIIIDEFQLKVIEITEIETALIGSNYAILISIDRFYAEVDYVNRNSANELKKYRCSSFFAEKYDEKDRVNLLEEHGAKEMIANNLTVISRGLLSKWRSILEGNVDWLETYKESSWASESYLHDFEIKKLNHYI